MDIGSAPSPNFGDRKGGAVELIVLHYTAMPDAEAALERLCDPEAEVSAHYLIAKTGEITRLVEDEKRAWHAGQGSWAGQDDVNSRSIGIELDNDGTSDFEEPLMEALEWLLGELLERHALEPKAVVAHSDIAPERKSDPGRLFDWQRLAAKGLSIWPDPAMAGDFMRDAANICRCRGEATSRDLTPSRVFKAHQLFAIDVPHPHRPANELIAISRDLLDRSNNQRIGLNDLPISKSRRNLNIEIALDKGLFGRDRE